jgi:large subunit ribosomal protein L46
MGGGQSSASFFFSCFLPSTTISFKMLKRTLFNTKRGLATASPLVIKNARIQASVILSRTPQITRDATPFEQAYFDYREKLERQESTATPTEFYFKKGSVAERRWKHEEQARAEAMKNNSASLTNAVHQSQATWEKENEGLATTTKADKLNRSTKSDVENNKQSLDRCLQRTLYLVVKKSGSEPWQFPESAVDTSEYLHEVILELEGEKETKKESKREK